MTSRADVLIPPSFLAFAARGDDWATWLDGLSRLSADLLDGWSLTLDGEAATESALWCSRSAPTQVSERS